MSFYVRFWGTRGSIPTPGYETRVYGGNTACIEMRIDETLFICDAGSGLRGLGLDLIKRGINPIFAHLFFSHAHWDHIQGFPFFVPAYDKENTFVVYGTSTGDDRFYELLSGQMDSDYFPVDFSDLGANIVAADLGDCDKTIEGVRVRCSPQIHHGPCFAYSFAKDGLKVVYSTDNELDLHLQNHDQVERDLRLVRLAPQDQIDFVRGASLLIADGQYTDEEYHTHRSFGHPRATTLVDLAVAAGVKQLAITHHDPLQSDEAVNKKIEVCKQRAALLSSDLVVFGAREGMELRLDAQQDNHLEKKV